MQAVAVLGSRSMLTKVRLQNYASFGALQEVPLEPITVLVGPNNSGKSCFLRFAEVVRSGGVPDPSLWHRPPVEGPFRIGWDAVVAGPDVGAPGERSAAYDVTVEGSEPGSVTRETVTIDGELLYDARGQVDASASAMLRGGSRSVKSGVGLPGLARSPDDDPLLAVVRPVVEARRVQLRVDCLRADTPLSEESMAADGTNLAGLVARWNLTAPATFDRLNEVLRRCIPEVRRVSARPVGRELRLQVEQQDGEVFDAAAVSDGVLVFVGLVAQVLQGPPRGLMLIEEPERGIHPRRLADLVDVLRALVHDQGTQFVLGTHSPALLNCFHDEPEAIVALRRGRHGTVAARATDLPDVLETLRRADPGELLASGAFHEALGG